MQGLKTRMELVSEQIFIQSHLCPRKDPWALPVRGTGSAFVPVPSHRGPESTAGNLSHALPTEGTADRAGSQADFQVIGGVSCKD